MSRENMGMGVVTSGPKSFYGRYFWHMVGLAIVIIGLGFIYVERQNHTVVWEGACEAVGHGHGFELFLDCAGKKIWINNQGVAFSYALNPGALDCKTYAMGGSVCTKRPFKK